MVALISWAKNPNIGKKSEVTVGEVKTLELILLVFITIGVTTGFYFILNISIQQIFL